MKKVLVTGIAGFIANRTAEFLLDEGTEVVGVDNNNDYYDVRLKDYRLSRLEGKKGFKPQVSITEGLKRTVESFNENEILNQVKLSI